MISIQTLYDVLLAVAVTVGIAVALAIVFSAAGALYQRDEARTTMARAAKAGAAKAGAAKTRVAGARTPNLGTVGAPFVPPHPVPTQDTRELVRH
jgi:hypothetical protein